MGKGLDIFEYGGLEIFGGRIGFDQTFLDDVLVRFGTDNDAVLVLSSAALSADEELANVIEGTSETQATAANSLLISNITNDSDIAIYVSKAGATHMAFLADGSTGDTALLASSGQSIDLYIAGTKILDYATTAFAFQENTTITSTGTLSITGLSTVTITDANGIDYNPGSDIDTDIVTVGVTGAPRLYWDESADAFTFTKGIATGGVTTTGYFQNIFGAAFTSDGGSIRAAKVMIDGVLTGANEDTARLSIVELQGQITTQNNSDAIAVVSQLYISEPLITEGNDTVVIAATLYIATAPDEGNINAGLYVAAGNTYLLGPLVYGAPGSLTIATGEVAVTKTYHTIVVQGGAGGGNDQLDTATGGVDGQLLILKASTSGGSDTVTVADGTGSNTFILAGGANFILDHVDDRLMCIYNGTEWVELSRSSNS